MLAAPRMPNLSASGAFGGEGGLATCRTRRTNPTTEAIAGRV